MEFRIIYLPPFKAISSGVDSSFDFTSDGVLGRFDAYFSTIKPSNRDQFMPRDFLFYDEEKQRMVWWYAISEDMLMNDEWEIANFEGGYYLTYFYKDGDDESNNILYKKAIEYIENSSLFELDVRKNHYPMGHIITPPEIINFYSY